MLIKLQDATKILDHRFVINNINFEFKSGNIYGIVGQNGSGKTMLLRAIAGLICLNRGTITVDGKVLNKDISFPPDIGIIIEKPELLPYLSGLENLKLLAEIRNIISYDDIKHYMDKFGLNFNSKQIVKKYSLGMKQKLGIIQAIMEDPSLLLLDEPFNALDAESVDILRSILLQYKEQGNIKPLSGIGAQVHTRRAVIGFQIAVLDDLPFMPPDFTILLVVPVIPLKTTR